MFDFKEKLSGKVAIISGGSRGIGAQTALTLAENGCHIVITGKTDKPHPSLEGTIHTVAESCRAFGVKALPIMCDVREEDHIKNVITQTVTTFGTIDILINSASAIYLLDTDKLNTKQFDLMYQINVRGTFLMSQAVIKIMKSNGGGHIVNFAPPLTMNANHFHQHLGYTLSKYGMSMNTLGMAHEYYHDHIAVNSLWPRTLIKTAATERLGNNMIPDKLMRKPTIMADAVLHIVTKPQKACTASFLIDDLVLLSGGVTDFNQYCYEPDHALLKDLFLPDDVPPPPEGVTLKML